MMDQDGDGLEFPPVFDIPPPPPPPWLEPDDPGCGSCHQRSQVSGYLGDTFYNIVIILVSVISMLIILFTLLQFLHRRLKKKLINQLESTIMSEYQI